MCLLAVIQPGLVVTDDEILDFTWYNEDGYGLMRVDGRRVVAVKGRDMSAFVPTFRAWLAHANDTGRPFAMHTRMRTSGEIDDANAHPFLVTPNVYLMHNGILGRDLWSGVRPEMCDTWHYASETLSKRRFPLDEAAQAEIGKAIGGGNKFVVADKSGLTIINRESGIEWRGSWFSNTYAWTAHSPRGAHRKFDWWDAGRVSQDSDDPTRREDARIRDLADWLLEYLDERDYPGTPAQTLGDLLSDFHSISPLDDDDATPLDDDVPFRWGTLDKEYYQ